MGERTGVLVRMTPELKRRIELRAIEAMKAKGITWSMNDEIVAILEAATKRRSDRG
jgi:hypothetical protein